MVNDIKHDLKVIYKRITNWVRDTFLVLGFITAGLLISGQLSSDISKEIKAKYDAQMLANNNKAQ